MDGSLMVWDLISSHLIDWVILEHPITSLDFHPNGLYLATSHKNSVGIYLWINKLIFGKMIFKHVKEPTKLSFNDWKVHNVEEEEDIEESNPEVELNEESIKLSGIPKQKLMHLMNLEEMRQSNKQDKDQAKIIAPFFLTTEINTEKTERESKILPKNEIDRESSSKMIKLIKAENREELMEYFRNESIKMIDISIRSLKSTENMLEMKLLLNFFVSELNSNQNFDLIQTLVHMFLNIHSELIIANGDDEEIFEILEKLKLLLNFEKMDELIHTNTSLIKILSGLPI
jgi:U3 small nucleolar RNA-associated protein 21